MTGCPMIVARDVAASADWYADILGGVNSHGGDEFAMIMHDGRLVLMLHHREVDGHPALEVPVDFPLGLGVLLYFWVDDVEAAFERARALGADVLDQPHQNPNARAIEFSLRDPDGYGVSIAAKARPVSPESTRA